MLRPVRKLVWEDAYSVINPQITASGVHEWHFDRSFPIDLRFFVMRREADIRLNHHAYFELLHVTSGEVEYQVGDRNYTLRQGDLFVMASALPHRMRRYGRSQIRCVTLYFMPEIIRGHDSTSDDVQYLMPFLVQNSGFPHVVPAESGVPAQILEFMKKIYAELPADSSRARLTVRTYLKMILVMLVNHYSEFRDSQPILMQKQRDLDRLQPLFDLIEEKYMNPISVNDAACAVHMSKSHLMRFFKQVTGQPFVAHLNRFRVAKARELLASTDRTIADIGQEVGFCNQSYFGLVFRRITGVSPREYKLSLASDQDVEVAKSIAAKAPPIARAV